MANHTQPANEIRFQARVVEVHFGEVARILVQLGDKRIQSIVTLQSAEELQLKPGDEVTVVVGSAGVRIAKAVGGTEPRCGG